MAFKISKLSKRNNTLKTEILDGYCLPNIETEYQEGIEKGFLFLKIWINEESRRNGGNYVGLLKILLGNKEILHTNENKNVNGVVYQFNISDFKNKTKIEIYNKIQKHKFLKNGEIIDFKKAEKC